MNHDLESVVGVTTQDVTNLDTILHAKAVYWRTNKGEKSCFKLEYTCFQPFFFDFAYILVMFYIRQEIRKDSYRGMLGSIQWESFIFLSPVKNVTKYEQV
jgi:hypothetical protein